MNIEDLSELLLIFQRLNLLSILDILLVATVFGLLLWFTRGTQAATLLRGILLLAVIVAILSSVLQLRAFSWLLRNTLPAIILSIPVIFQPELRRGLDRIGRASTWFGFGTLSEDDPQPQIQAITTAAQRLSDLRYGALIVIEREVGLQEHIDTGIALDSQITPELLQQIFYKDTPLHDGAVIIRGDRIAAAACVLPLSTDTSLTSRQLGLRHRASLGISEVSDAVAVVISEETGVVSVVHNGRMIRRLDANRLRNVLDAFYRPRFDQGLFGRWLGWLPRRQPKSGTGSD